MPVTDKGMQYLLSWRADWNKFIRDALHARLDPEQQAIVDAVQHNKMVAVASGTSRGKDFVSACICLSFLYLTPRWENGILTKNTKVIMTAPTGRQVKNIMTPEVTRLFNACGFLPGRLVGDDIRTANKEWFLTGFKADENNTEAWSGLHAYNIMFAVTEASGISETIFNAIEGNLQGNSRLLIVFNPNVPSGYAAKAMTSPRFKRFRLNSLHAENVVKKKIVIPGQVDYEWVKDKVSTWCRPIQPADFNEGEGDFEWEGGVYRPNDLFRIKVLGMFPKTSSDIIIPYEWVELANQRYLKLIEEQGEGWIPDEPLRLGIDVAGMGRDSSYLVPRYGNYIKSFVAHQSAGQADHMHVAGLGLSLFHERKNRKGWLLIDTIGEGAGVLSRYEELGIKGATSCKFSESAKDLTDVTGQYKFANMRAYLYWSLRDWLDPKNNTGAAIPPNDAFAEEVTNTKWKFQSNGSIIIEPKDDIKERLGRSPDAADAVVNTFYPVNEVEDSLTDEQIAKIFD